MARISVIVPAYNAADFIAVCIESIIHQTCEDWELIIINDGSKDGTGSICDEYARNHSRIRVIHQENGGVSTARNRGLTEAKGELIAFADADDSLAPGALEILLSLIDDNGVSTSACAHSNTYTNGTPPVYEAPPAPAGVYSPDESLRAISLPLLCDRLSPSPLNGYVWRYLFSREIIEKNSIRFTGKYLEDELFLIEYFCCGASLAVTDKSLYNYLQNEASVTKKYLPAFTSTFLASLLKKDRLVSTYSIPVTAAWRENTCWAGLLIAVSNECAPGNKSSLNQKADAIRRICTVPEFAKAIESYSPTEIQGNKALVASLLRRRMYLPLALVYSAKNFIRR